MLTPLDEIERDPIADRANLYCGIAAAVILAGMAAGVAWSFMLRAGWL